MCLTCSSRAVSRSSSWTSEAVLWEEPESGICMCFTDCQRTEQNEHIFSQPHQDRGHDMSPGGSETFQARFTSVCACKYCSWRDAEAIAMCATGPAMARGSVGAEQKQSLQERNITHMILFAATRVGHKDNQTGRWYHNMLLAKCQQMLFYRKSAGCLSD